MNLQTYKKRGLIRMIKCGHIAVDIPKILKAKKAELRGFSSKTIDGSTSSFWDIAINDLCVLHIFRSYHGDGKTFPPYYFWDVYPF